MDVKISEFSVLETPLSSNTFIPIIYQGVNYIKSADTIWNTLLVDYVNITGLNYTLALSDSGYYIRKSHNIPHYIYIPSDSSQPFVDGTVIPIRNSGTASLTLTSNVLGVSLNYDNTVYANVLDPNTSAQLIKIGYNTWDLY